MTKLKKVLIMAGGTGGHVFPALAIARTLSEQGIEVHWLGTEKGLEAKVIPDANIPLHFISIGGLRGKGWKNLLLAPFRLCAAIWQAGRIIKQLKPDVVLGFGGFVSGPGGIASLFLKKRLVIHEQNAKAGLTNQFLSYFATRVLEGFPHTFKQSKRIVTIGNPVRPEITRLLPPHERFHDRQMRLLVMGGSLGAAAINELIPQALSKMALSERPLVRHQTGEKHHADTLKKYELAKVSVVEIVPFINDMAEAYEWADLVLCRAGASTIAELCAVGVGAILVPYPYAVDDHQTTNALYLTNHKAALLIQQANLSEDVLIDWLKEFTKTPEKRLSMAQSAFNLRRIDASKRVLEICKEICN